MYLQGVLFLLVAMSCFTGCQVKGQTTETPEEDIPVQVKISDSAKGKYSGLVEISCYFEIQPDTFSAVWWRLNNDIIFFQQKEAPGSRLGNHGDMIMDYKLTLNEAQGASSEHRIFIDANLCHDRWKFQCQVISTDNREGIDEAKLMLKEADAYMKICDFAKENCSSQMIENSTHSISCLVEGARHEPNITIEISNQAIPHEVILSEKDEKNCFHSAEERAEVTLDPKVTYDVRCLVRDKYALYISERTIGPDSNNSVRFNLHAALAAMLFLRWLL